MSENVWVIDDDQSIRWVLERAYQQEGMQVKSFSSADSALRALHNTKVHPDAIVSDIRMPGLDGLDFLKQIHQGFPDTPVIIMTAHSDLDSAVAAYEGGAFEYLPKPFDVDEAIDLTKRACHASKESSGAQSDISQVGEDYDIIGNAPAMQEVFRAIGRLSRSNITVMINGESGTGKELIARALHRHSPRADAPFIALNMAAIPHELMESELFGHEKGAFTDAHRQKVGHFEAAGAGTLFLDEITETPAKTQISLLRVLEEREFRRVGSETVRPFHARVVSASNQDMERLVEDGGFREDLYYRLNVVPIHLPPLRERRDDIPLLVNHFMESFSRRHRQEPKQLAPQVMLNLIDRPWPGNIRQLKNYVERLVVTVDRPLVRLEDLPKEANHSRATSAVRRLNEAVEEAERQALGQALIHAGYHRERAADLLGISVRSLHYKMSRYGLH